MNDDILVGRFRSLERENRYLKLAGLLLLAVLAGVGAVQRDGGPTLTAQKLVLVDADGATRAIVSADEKGGLLVFKNKRGDSTLRVGLVGDEPRVETWDTARQEWRNWIGPVRVIPVR